MILVLEDRYEPQKAKGALNLTSQWRFNAWRQNHEKLDFVEFWKIKANISHFRQKSCAYTILIEFLAVKKIEKYLFSLRKFQVHI